jgi:acyl carrier protein/polyketide biosynthesis acyl carrier protein
MADREDEMTREAILAIVTRHIAEAVEGLRAADVDPARSMTDHDLGSLDIVDVVGRSMRELQVTVPQTELRRLATINDFVDALHRAVERKSI